MRKRRLCTIVSLTLTLGLLMGCGGAADSGADSEASDVGAQYDKVNLLMSCNGTDIANDARTAKLFAEKVAEKSGGRINVTVFPNDQLAGGNMSKGLEMPNGEGAPFALIQNKEITVTGSNMYTHDDYEAVMECLAKGLIDTSLMITQRYNIEKVEEAMSVADKRPEPVIKVMLNF